MNEEIYNISYDALTTIMELSGIILEETIDKGNAYIIVKAIRKISVETKQIMFEKNQKYEMTLQPNNLYTDLTGQKTKKKKPTTK